MSHTVLNGTVWTESKWKPQGWILFQTLFALSTQMTDNLQTRHECETREEKIKEKKN